MSARALRALRALEWSNEHGACPSCRACRRCDEQDGRTFAGHRPDCELAAAIREMEAARCFNVNETIRVTLTEVGLRILREHNERAAAWFAAHVPGHDFQGVAVDKRNRLTDQAWVVFQIFGSALELGRTPPFLPSIELAPFEMQP